MDHTIGSMQRRSKSMAEDRAALMGRLQGAIAIRSLLLRSAGRQPGAAPPPPSKRGRVFPRGKTVRDAPGTPGETPGPGAPTAPPSRGTGPGAPMSAGAGAPVAPTGPSMPGATRVSGPRAGTATKTAPARPAPIPTQQRGSVRPGRTVPAAHPHHPPETSARSTQNIVLGLGALVMAGAVTLTPFLYGSLGGGIRVLILAALTIVAIGAPIVLSRRGLLTTSEWISPLGLLFVLLDGQELWSSTLRHAAIRPTTYAGLVALVAAGVALGYQRVTALAVPRFAAIALFQPVPALLVYPLLTDAAAWAAVITFVAAIDLVIALWSRRAATHGPYLRFAVRRLQEGVNAAALICGAVALAQAHDTVGSVRAGATVVSAAVVALAAGLLFREFPVSDISAGVATVAAIAGFGRMGALAVPGWGLTATAIAVTALAFGVYALPAYARIGAQIAGGTAAICTAIVVVIRGWPALSTPLAASSPAWSADLTGYVQRVTHGAGHGSGQLVTATLLLAIAAAIMLPAAWRRDSLVIGVALATVLAPGAWHLPWALAIVSGAIVALGLGVVALSAANDVQSWIGIGAAFTVGAYATGIAIARPAAQALLLIVFAIGGAAIGATMLLPAFATAPATTPLAAPATLPRMVAGAIRLRGMRPNARAADAGWGGAAFALPGAIAAATAALSSPGVISPEAVLAASFVTVAGTLSVAAVSQVARRRPSPLLVGGAGLGALAVAIAAIRTQGLSSLDLVVALVLLVSAVLLAVAPIMSTGFRPAGAGRWRLASLDGDEIAAAAVTGAAIAALARVASLVAPGLGMVMMALLVLIVAAGTRSMPLAWRRGPIVGGGIVGISIGIAAGYAALNVAITAIQLNRPLWHVNLIGWTARLDDHTIASAHGPQAALALLLLAAAAAIVLPEPSSQIAVAVAVGLAALVAPETLGTGWWGPVLFSGTVATASGIAAGMSRDKAMSLTRAAVATLLFANTIAASLVRAGTMAVTLVASAAVCGAVAATAARTINAMRSDGKPRDDAHLVIIGGGALAGGILALAGGMGTIAAAAHESLPVVLTAAMGGLALALAVLAPVAFRIAPLLPHATAAISIGGLAIALASVADLTTAGVFASVAALLAVLAEVMRTAVRQARGRRPEVGWLPQRTQVLLAAGPATTLAVASIAPTVVAALVGPYHWIGMIWRGAPDGYRGELGASASLVGHPIGLLTAVVLTVMATIGAIGFGGTRTAIVTRAVAVVTPGLAFSLLIAPYLLRAAWPAGPLAALAVAAISGLALALTLEAPDTDAASALRAARRLVVVMCAVSAGAGLAGSLATKPMTMTALATATAIGIVAALRGSTQVSRVTGWIVTATAGELLALVTSLLLGIAVYSSAFVVGAVAAALLLVAALLPQLRRPENRTETLTVEVSAFAGAVLGMALAARSVPHLAVFLGAWGAVLGFSAARPQRSRVYRSSLMWTAAAHELAAWFLLLAFARVAVPEAYTLGIAVVALLTGWIELRWHPELTSWVSYGIALAAALGPSLIIVIATNETTLRLVLLLIGAAAVLIAGAIRRQQAPTIIGGVALLGAVINLIARYSATVLVLLLLAIIAGVLIGVGANFEKQRRNVQRIRSVFTKMQ
jgi:hypothetical protein